MIICVSGLFMDWNFIAWVRSGRLSREKIYKKHLRWDGRKRLPMRDELDMAGV